MATVIPGALADHLTGQTITDAETVGTLDAARRGRGRTLVIEPTSTRVLHVISAYAEAILENRKRHTAAQVRAARLWIQRVGHSPAPAAVEQAPAAVRDEPSDWWTIMDPATGEEIARVYGETYQEMTPRAEALPEVHAVIRKHKGFSRRRLYVSELTPAQLAEQAEAPEQALAQRRQQLADSRPANAYPLAVAAVRRFVTDMPQASALRVRVTQGSPAATLTRDDLHALAYSGHTTAGAVARVRAAVAAHIRHGEREVYIMFPALGMRPALYLPDVMALLHRWDDQAEARLDQAVAEAGEPFDRAARAADAVEHAEQVEAAVETVEDAEALYAAALVTEAETTEGTWRGAWIGEQPADDVLFAVESTVEQGALFAPAVAAREPIVARASFRPADLDRIKGKAAADRTAYRAETDDRIAAECAAHGVAPSQGVRDRIAARAAEQAPARRVIEGVIVQHAGTAEGSTPSNASHPDVVAARAALDGLAVATMTDHHDVTEPTEGEQHVRGYLIDPRTHGRVAVYWLEGGRTVRRDQMPHGPALDCLADRLQRRGWAVEKMLRSSQCVFAHRPSTN